ncbi:MAG: lycopene beta-cyclase [Arcticibacterium sp.]|jgi:lycopene beta-cyclase
MAIIKVDFTIIGAGSAGLQLAMGMAKDSYFDDKKIVLFDPEPKNKNDRTWSYWEIGAGEWDNHLVNSWSLANFFSSSKTLSISTAPYRYKTLRSIDFYNQAKTVLSQKGNILWIGEEVVKTSEMDGGVELQTASESYNSGHCFDSRIDKAFLNEMDGKIRILQHFKGRIVRFKKPVFKVDEFTIMDFRMPWKNTTSFVYVLPKNEYEAMIEYTFFTKDTVVEKVYDEMLDRYIDTYVSKDSYDTLEEEIGVIPMSNFKFEVLNTNSLTKIGTAGGWVRGSTGYAFKRTGNYVKKVINNIKAEDLPSKGLIKKRYRLFDTLLLDILEKRNHIMPEIFADIYANNPIDRVFRFLDGESTLWDDFRIMNSVKPWPFLKAIWNQWFMRN